MVGSNFLQGQGQFSLEIPGKFSLEINTPMMQTAFDLPHSTDHILQRLDAYCVALPYLKPIKFKSVHETRGQYLVIRLTLDDGTEGIAEAICRPEVWGEDAELLARMVIQLFDSTLKGRDPFDLSATTASLRGFPGMRAARSLLEQALWDLRGKTLAQPVWKLLGATTPRPVPLTWIAHGDTSESMVEEAVRQAERGFSCVKIKTWRQSMEDVDMVALARRRLGPETGIYVDANSSYSIDEARSILSRVQDFDVRFIEDPCKFSSPEEQASFRASLSTRLLTDRGGIEPSIVDKLIDAGATGAITLHMRQSGFSESLEIVEKCAAANVQVVLGTDSESRLGALARMHFHVARAECHSAAAETHFFEKLADDIFEGAFNFIDGAMRLDDSPGFGGSINRDKIAAYSTATFSTELA